MRLRRDGNVTTDPHDAIEELEDELYEPFFCPHMIELVTKIRNESDILLAIQDCDDLHHETPIENIFEWASELVEYCVDDED